MKEISDQTILIGLLRYKMTSILGKKLLFEDISTAQFIGRVEHEALGPNDMYYMGDFKGKYFTYRIKHNVGVYGISRTTLLNYAYHKMLPPNSVCRMCVKIMDHHLYGYIIIKNRMGNGLPDAFVNRLNNTFHDLSGGGAITKTTIMKLNEAITLSCPPEEYIDYPSQVLPRMIEKHRVCFSSQRINSGLRETYFDPSIRDLEPIFKTRDDAKIFIAENIGDVLEVLENAESWLFNLQLCGYSVEQIQKIIFHLGYSRGNFCTDSTYGKFHEQYLNVGQQYLQQLGITL